jgi:hypothetical protein
VINILSLNCSLAFAPYLLDAFSEFQAGTVTPRSVRQGGSGLIIRGDEGLVLVHQNRTVTLNSAEVAHYQATGEFRAEFYDVARTSGEVMLATVNEHLLLSHPQSAMWLRNVDVSFLAAEFRKGAGPEITSASPADWLNVSAGASGLLISDQRTGRWVLLGDDQVAELERRLPALAPLPKSDLPPGPPTISVKGVVVHLQSASNLARHLRLFGEGGTVTEFSEQAPKFRLTALPRPDGLELMDAQSRVTVTRKEAPKWVAIIDEQLAALHVDEIDRGNVRTVFADGDGGRWVLQWGDEVFLPTEFTDPRSYRRESATGSLILKRCGEYSVALDRVSGNCIAMTEDELERAGAIAQSAVSSFPV